MQNTPSAGYPENTPAIEPSPKLYMRTFSPYRLSGDLLHYDSLAEVLRRLNQWLAATGARVYSVETGFVRLQSDSDPNEAMKIPFSVNSPGVCYPTPDPDLFIVDPKLFLIRVYLSGTFSEPVNGIMLVNPNSHSLEYYIEEYQPDQMVDFVDPGNTPVAIIEKPDRHSIFENNPSATQFHNQNLQNGRQSFFSAVGETPQPPLPPSQTPAPAQIVQPNGVVPRGPVGHKKPEGYRNTLRASLPEGPQFKTKGNIKNGIHVVHIGIDGLHPTGIIQAGAHEILNRFAKCGTHTLSNAMSGQPSCSAAGWTETLTGLPSANIGIDSDNWTPDKRRRFARGSGLEQGKPLPTIFHVLKSQKKNTSTAAFYDWEWLRYLMEDNDLKSMDVECYIDPMERWSAADATLVDETIDYLGHALPQRQRSYTFLYLGNVKDMGHKLGFLGDQYLDAIREADRQVGRILDTIDEIAPDRTVVLLSAYHSFHGIKEESASENFQVPLFLKGPGIRPGCQFQNQIKNLDIAPTIAGIMKFQSSPLWTGQEMAEAYDW